MLSREDYLYFTDRALDGMAAIVVELGDERANRAAYPGANSPYALLHHCLCVIETWVGGFVRGRPIDRDRDAEFTATGPVELLVERCATVRAQMHTDVVDAHPEQFLLQEPPRTSSARPPASPRAARCSTCSKNSPSTTGRWRPCATSSPPRPSDRWRPHECPTPC
ncbi:DinB family protein [Saccharopolyspora spinosporotrichia]